METGWRLSTTSPALHALEARYFVENLSASRAHRGAIFRFSIRSGGSPRQSQPMAFTWQPPTPEASPDSSQSLPSVRPKRDPFADLAGDGGPADPRLQRNAYRGATLRVRGPVLIDEGAATQWPLPRFNAITRQAYADIFDTGVLFCVD